MKILIFSDLHLHNWNYGSTIVDGMNDRLRDQARVLDQIATYCERNEVDHIVFGGDLFHTHGKIDASVLKVAYEGVANILAKSNVYMTLLVGNHDTADKSMNTHALHWLRAFGEQVRVIDSAWHDMEMDVSFLPYTENENQIEKFLRMSQPLAFMHQGVSGVPMGSGFVINEVFTPDMVRHSHIQHVFTGHYHKHTGVNNQLTVIGSTTQLTWADEGDKRGFLVYDTEFGSIEHIESVAPKFVMLDWQGIYQTTIDSIVSDNFVRVVNYDHGDQEDIRKELTGAGARSVEFVVEKQKVERLQPIQSNKLHLPEIVEEYERQHNISPELSKVGKELMK